MNRVFVIIAAIAISLASCKTTKTGKKPTSAYKPAIENKIEANQSNKASNLVEEKSTAPDLSSISVRSENISVASGEDMAKGNFAFYVIVGSFSNYDNANRQKNLLLGKGFSPVIIQNESGMFRVSIKQTNSEAEARETIGEIRTNFEQYKDTWLLKKK